MLSFPQTLAEQRQVELDRGWDPSKIGPLAYSTVEVVVVNRSNRINPLDWQILEARRRNDRGVPDCRGRWQGKWGTQVRPLTDASPKESAERCIREFFGEKFTGKFSYAGGTGPWVHKAMVLIESGEPYLKVLHDQCESTPWEGKIFAFETKHLKFDPEGGHTAVHGGNLVGWKTLRELITEQGQDENYLHWLVVSLALGKLMHGDYYDTTPRYWEPGTYKFL